MKNNKKKIRLLAVSNRTETELPFPYKLRATIPEHDLRPILLCRSARLWPRFFRSRLFIPHLESRGHRHVLLSVVSVSVDVVTLGRLMATVPGVIDRKSVV